MDFFFQNQKHFNECFIFFFNKSQGHTLKGLRQFLKENEKCGIAVWFLITFFRAFLITVCLTLNFPHFHLFSQNTTQISTKLGTKQPWVKRIQVCLNEGPPIFPRRDNNKIAKIHSKFKKIFLPRTKGPMLTELDTIKASLGDDGGSNEGPCPSQRGDNMK